MLKTACYLIGLVFMASLIPGVGISQANIDTTGARVDISKKSTFDLGARDDELTGVRAKIWTSPDCAFDRGPGWLDGGDIIGGYDGPYDGESCIQGHSLDDTGSSETAKETIIIDLKIPISAFDIVGLNVYQKSNGYLIRIHCTKQLPDFESWLKPIGDDTWLYITLADAKADVVVLQNFKPTAFVEKIIVIQSETSVQLTFLLKGQVNSAELIPAGGSQDILVAVFTPTEEQLAISKTR
jgi:hypothetical protein